MGRRKGEALGENKLFLGEINESLEEKTGGMMIVYDKVYLDMMTISSPLSCDKSQSSLADEIPREGIYN